MTDFDAIDALLAAARQEVPLPDVTERRVLREGLNLSRAQVAQALGVSPSTVGGWESGRDPSGEVREKYAYFLSGARARLAERTGPAEPTGAGEREAEREREQDPAAEGAAESAAGSRTGGEVAGGVGTDDSGPVNEGSLDEGSADEGSADEVEALAEPRACVLCGGPARQQVAGFPQHLDPAECSAPVTPAPSPAQTSGPSGPGAAHGTGGTAPRTAAPRTAGPGARAPRPPARTAGPASRSGDRDRGGDRTGDRGGVRIVAAGRRAQAASAAEADPIAQAVSEALTQHSGDVEAATAALVRRAIPDAMALLDHTRKGGRYDVVAHPWLPDVLHKQSARGADQIWEARPKWTRPELPPGTHEVTALDVNGAYLSALKTHLPLGQLEHSTGDHHDRRRAGVHLITPPEWEHDAVLPNPIGSREEPGPLWVTEPTLRLLLRLSGPKYGLCDPPEIHESWTSGATENLLEKFRVALKDARDRALAEDDEVTLTYVKAMYSKFVSTLGESNYNREIYRTDWMHLIRSQAFVNLWWKAHRCYDEGLLVVRAMGTDELHVTGDWRGVFPEGRGLTEVKVKDTYTVEAEDGTPAGVPSPEGG
ncbi:helix-turn-helix domain-containing protein [Streptomyces sp. NRRL S-340]|uniref:helix-turn-helix domain-containing protein n=1 Tax=Streptomyces sp. NRRL S-340 TaxID=1463901 RepID=UPI00056D6DC6|nr:helix-turn-helix transcriptional regulator [Streptomyces sp. NRRL S-340]